MPVIRFTVGGDYDSLSYLIADNAASGITLVQPSGVNFSISSNTPSAPVIASGVVLASSVDDGLYLDFSDSSDPLFATGGDRGDVFVGGAGNDQLTGGAGNDVLTGGLGNDLLNGGDGIDTVRYDDQTIAVTVNLNTTTAQITGRGNDTILDVENVIGSVGNDNITGNAANNVLDGGTGNDALNGGDGDDILKVGYGTTGRDTVHGDAGSDTAMITGPSDSDLFFISQSGTHVSFAKGGVTFLDAYDIETYDFTLPGGSTLALNTLTSGTLNLAIGAGGSQVTTASVGANVVTNITDGAGNDRISAGAGQDNLFYDHGGSDVIANLSGAGITVNGEAVAANTIRDDYGFTDTVSGTIESITTGAGNDAIYGGATAMRIATGDGDDSITIQASALNGSVIDGGAGNDSVHMTLDASNYYLVGTASESEIDGFNSGTAVAHFTGVETLYVTVAGGRLSNFLTDGTAALYAAAGGSMLDASSAGAATYTVFIGGAGNDSFAAGDGYDRVKETGGDVVANFRGNDYLEPVGLAVANTIRSSFGGTDTLTNAGTFNEIQTGAGNDYIIAHDRAMTIRTGAGNDTVLTGAGIDIVYGGAGDDIVYVSNAADKVYENDGDGTDTVHAYVSFSLAGQYIENLVLEGSGNGTGNSLDNSITGSFMDNVLRGMAGNDTLDGGEDGLDQLYGGLGDDTYHIDHLGETAYEIADEGYDTVVSSVSYNLTGQYIEALTLTGNAAISGTGNSLENVLTGNGAANVLRGLAGNDSITGNGGADKMYGGTGDDSYYVDNATQHVYENADEGYDTVFASVTFSLAGQYVEELHLTGDAAINGTGNSLNNVLYGNDADNRLVGGAGDDNLHGGFGNDTLYGGAGADHYWFDTTPGEGNVDFLADFNAGEDSIYLDLGVFSGIEWASTLSADQFHLGAAAQTADERIVYDKATGNIWYDADGSGDGAAVLFARVAAGTALSADDFHLRAPAA